VPSWYRRRTGIRPPNGRRSFSTSRRRCRGPPPRQRWRPPSCLAGVHAAKACTDPAYLGPAHPRFEPPLQGHRLMPPSQGPRRRFDARRTARSSGGRGSFLSGDARGGASRHRYDARVCAVAHRTSSQRNNLTRCTTHPQTGKKELAPLALKSLTSLVMITVGAVVLSADAKKKAAENSEKPAQFQCKFSRHQAHH